MFIMAASFLFENVIIQCNNLYRDYKQKKEIKRGKRVENISYEINPGGKHSLDKIIKIKSFIFILAIIMLLFGCRNDVDMDLLPVVVKYAIIFFGAFFLFLLTLK